MDDSTRKEIVGHYQHGRGSIQDLARIYRVSVQEVLDLVGEPNITRVRMPGDLIDAQDAGQGAVMNYGRDVDVPISLD